MIRGIVGEGIGGRRWRSHSAVALPKPFLDLPIHLDRLPGRTNPRAEATERTFIHSRTFYESERASEGNKREAR